MKKEFITKSAEETQKLGESLVKRLIKRKADKEAAVLALEGDLGGGKTTFVQGMARVLNIKERITSPSFVLIKKYQITPPQPSPYIRGGRREGLRNFYHIDCYRLTKSWQLQELGFGEIINSPQNLVVIEWAQRIPEILPGSTTRIEFEWIGENRRKIKTERM
jgi:tRNA threonylcarbamoyladenosine biosynthesis protein TsaE